MGGQGDAHSRDATVDAILQRFAFNPHDLRPPIQLGGRFAPHSVTPPSGLDALPSRGTDDHARLTQIGAQALDEGKVGAVILAGGMATRFGSVIKALVPAYRGRSFLDLKLRDLELRAEAAGRPIHALFMSSFQSHDPLVSALAARDPRRAELVPADVFPQDVALRRTPAGELFRTTSGDLSPYAPGHGDLVDAMRRSGALERFMASGGEHLLMSNVDNLLATLDPAIVGVHVDGGAALTVENVHSDPGDRGGAPALAEGKLQIVEAFRFPEGFDPATIPVFNTNTIAMRASAVDRDFELDHFYVEKEIEGRVAVQYERLVGQLTAHLETRFLVVPRRGPEARFAPIKRPADLDTHKELVEAALSARGVF